MEGVYSCYDECMHEPTYTYYNKCIYNIKKFTLYIRFLRVEILIPKNQNDHCFGYIGISIFI